MIPAPLQMWTDQDKAEVVLRSQGPDGRWAVSTYAPDPFLIIRERMAQVPAEAFADGTYTYRCDLGDRQPVISRTERERLRRWFLKRP